MEKLALVLVGTAPRLATAERPVQLEGLAVLMVLHQVVGQGPAGLVGLAAPAGPAGLAGPAGPVVLHQAAWELVQPRRCPHLLLLP